MRKLYLAGPMSRESFCRCDRPSTWRTLPIAADLIGAGVRNAVLLPDVLVGHSGSPIHPHGVLIGYRPQGPFLPERDLLQGARRTTLTEQGKHVPQEADGVVSISRPLEERLLPEAIRGIGAADPSNSAALGHELQDIPVGGADLDSQRPLVVGAVDDGALPLVEASAPGDICDCPFHDFILPDDGVDQWDFNYPAFHRAAAKLREAGHHVESPAEPGQVDGWAWSDYVRRGLVQMLGCDAVAVLPGWHLSKGAFIEVTTADRVGLSVMSVGWWLARPAIPDGQNEEVA